MPLANLPLSPSSRPSYPVLVEQQSDHSWIAQILGWAECRAQGTSREAAIAALQTALTDRLARAEVIYLDMPEPVPDHPLMKYAGMFRADPQFDEVLAEIAAYRRELDAERDELTDLRMDG
jgi:predicted RNase H-like HicB family nuclease